MYNSLLFHLATTGFWFVFFLVVFRILKHRIPVPSKIALIPDKKKQLREFCAYVHSYLSLLHALVNLGVSCAILLSHKFYYLERNQWASIQILCFSAGYYLNSTLVGQVHKFHQLSMVFHHVILVLEILYSLTTGYWANIIIAGFAVAEGSNPFRIVKNISDGHLEYKNLGDVSIRIFAVVFLFLRWNHQLARLPVRPLRVPDQPHPSDPEADRRVSL